MGITQQGRNRVMSNEFEEELRMMASSVEVIHDVHHLEARRRSVVIHVILALADKLIEDVSPEDLTKFLFDHEDEVRRVLNRVIGNEMAVFILDCSEVQ